MNKGYRFRHIGRKDRMPQSLLESINQLEEKTSGNTGKTLVLALDYGGRDEIVRAINKTEGQVMNEDDFKNLLDTAGLPDPDLIIRTSGEMRTSGIMPWQTTYTELFFSKLFFPDFTIAELKRAISDYSSRQRRFGQQVVDIVSQFVLSYFYSR